MFRKILSITACSLCILLAISIYNNINLANSIKKQQIQNNIDQLNNNYDKQVSFSNDDIEKLVIGINDKLVEDVYVEIIDDSVIFEMIISKEVIEKVKDVVGTNVSGILNMFIDQKVKVKVSKGIDEIEIEHIKIKDLLVPKKVYEEYEDKINEFIIDKMKELKIEDFSINENKINVYTDNIDEILQYLN